MSSGVPGSVSVSVPGNSPGSSPSASPSSASSSAEAARKTGPISPPASLPPRSPQKQIRSNSHKHDEQQNSIDSAYIVNTNHFASGQSNTTSATNSSRHSTSASSSTSPPSASLASSNASQPSSSSLGSSSGHASSANSTMQKGVPTLHHSSSPNGAHSSSSADLDIRENAIDSPHRSQPQSAPVTPSGAYQSFSADFGSLHSSRDSQALEGDEGENSISISSPISAILRHPIRLPTTGSVSSMVSSPSMIIASEALTALRSTSTSSFLAKLFDSHIQTLAAGTGDPIRNIDTLADMLTSTEREKRSVLELVAKKREQIIAHADEFEKSLAYRKKLLDGEMRRMENEKVTLKGVLNRNIKQTEKLTTAVSEMDSKRCQLLSRVHDGVLSWEVRHHFHLISLCHSLGLSNQPNLLDVATLIPGHLRIATLASRAAKRQSHLQRGAESMKKEKLKHEKRSRSINKQMNGKRSETDEIDKLMKAISTRVGGEIQRYRKRKYAALKSMEKREKAQRFVPKNSPALTNALSASPPPQQRAGGVSVSNNEGSKSAGNPRKKTLSQPDISYDGAAAAAVAAAAASQEALGDSDDEKNSPPMPAKELFASSQDSASGANSNSNSSVSDGHDRSSVITSASLTEEEKLARIDDTETNDEPTESSADKSPQTTSPRTDNSPNTAQSPRQTLSPSSPSPPTAPVSAPAAATTTKANQPNSSFVSSANSSPNASSTPAASTVPTVAISSIANRSLMDGETAYYAFGKRMPTATVLAIASASQPASTDYAPHSHSQLVKSYLSPFLAQRYMNIKRRYFQSLNLAPTSSSSSSSSSGAKQRVHKPLPTLPQSPSTASILGLANNDEFTSGGDDRSPTLSSLSPSGSPSKPSPNHSPAIEPMSPITIPPSGPEVGGAVSANSASRLPGAAAAAAAVGGLPPSAAGAGGKKGWFGSWNGLDAGKDGKDSGSGEEKKRQTGDSSDEEIENSVTGKGKGRLSSTANNLIGTSISASTSPAIAASISASTRARTLSSGLSPAPPARPAPPTVANLYAAEWHELGRVVSAVESLNESQQIAWEQLELILDRRERVKTEIVELKRKHIIGEDVNLSNPSQHAIMHGSKLVPSSRNQSNGSGLDVSIASTAALDGDRQNTSPESSISSTMVLPASNSSNSLDLSVSTMSNSIAGNMSDPKGKTRSSFFSSLFGKKREKSANATLPTAVTAPIASSATNSTPNTPSAANAPRDTK